MRICLHLIIKQPQIQVMFEFYLANNPTDQQKEIISAYWERNEYGFCRKPGAIAKANGMSISQLTALIKKYSKYIYAYGQCIDCDTSLECEVQSQSLYDLYYPDYHPAERCDECRETHRKRCDEEMELEMLQREQELERIKNQRRDEAIQNKVWRQLSTEELTILHGIVKYKDMQPIFRFVFDPKAFSNWSIVHRLEGHGLIWTDRDWRNYIKAFHFKEELEGYLEGEINVNNNYVYGKNQEWGAKADDPDEVFKFMLRKNIRPESVNSPQYSSTFQLEKDVVIKAGVEYLYGGWVNTDGSINFKFTPLASIQKMPVHRDISNAPESIKVILEGMANNFESDKNDFDDNENDDYEDAPF